MGQPTVICCQASTTFTAANSKTNGRMMLLMKEKRLNEEGGEEMWLSQENWRTAVVRSKAGEPQEGQEEDR